MKYLYNVCLGAKKNTLGFGSLWIDVEMDRDVTAMTDSEEIRAFYNELNETAIGMGETLCPAMKGSFHAEENHYDRAVPTTAEEYLGPEYKAKVAKVQAAFQEVIRVADAEGLRLAVSRNTSPASDNTIVPVPVQPVPDHFRIDLPSLREKLIPLLQQGRPLPRLGDIYYSGN